MQTTPSLEHASLDELLAQYWDCAFEEGRTGRTHDTHDSLAQRTLCAIRARFGAADQAPTPEAVEVDRLMADYWGCLYPRPEPSAAPPAFRVFVDTMFESHRVTYWTTIVRADRPKDAMPWNATGKITPFMSKNLEHAEHEARAWAEFLQVPVEPFVKPEGFDAQVAKLQARQGVNKES
jgi:hypothetical protein